MSTNSVGSVETYRARFANVTGDAAAMKKIENQYEGEILSTEEEYQMVQANQEHQSECQKTGAILGGIGGFVAGAATGAAIGAACGSVVPGIGTAIGAAVGCLIGIIGGIIGGNVVHENSEIDNYTDETVENSQNAKEQANLQKQEYLNNKYNKGKATADRELESYLVGYDSEPEETEEEKSTQDTDIFNTEEDDKKDDNPPEIITL